MAQVVLENIYKSFSSRPGENPSGSDRVVGLPEDGSAPTGTAKSSVTAVLRRINLTVQDGEFMVLVGPSGCGKSTLLRLIAGLEELTGGTISVGDRQVNDLPPKERDIAMVFQSYALYPHMTVYDNLAFGLRRTRLQRIASSPWETLLSAVTRKLPKQFRYWSDGERAVDERVRRVAQILQIEPLLHRLPKQLSGGQKQRVALGRAMAREPQVFLMDEPLSNLDAKLRTETRAQIVKLQRQLRTTTIYVTHDQTEAMTMGDRIAVMNAGQIQQIAPPMELYHYPANRFVAEFIGSPPMNFLTVQVQGTRLTHPQFHLDLPESWLGVLQSYDGSPLTLGIRPEHLLLSEENATGGQCLQVQVDRVEALGNETYLTVNLLDGAGPGAEGLQARISPDHRVQVGDRLDFTVALDKIHLFHPETGLAVIRG